MGVESSKKRYFKSNKVEHSNEKIYIGNGKNTIIDHENKTEVQSFINKYFETSNLTEETKIILSKELTLEINIKETNPNSPAVDEAVKVRNKKIELMREQN